MEPRARVGLCSYSKCMLYVPKKPGCTRAHVCVCVWCVCVCGVCVCVAWRGVAWRGVAWRGVARRGVAWRGMCLCSCQCFDNSI